MSSCHVKKATEALSSTPCFENPGMKKASNVDEKDGHIRT